MTRHVQAGSLSECDPGPDRMLVRIAGPRGAAGIKNADPGLKRSVAEALKSYKPIFDRLDALWMFDPPRDLEEIITQRIEQQDTLNRGSGKVGMTCAQISRFIRYFYEDSWQPGHTVELDRPCHDAGGHYHGETSRIRVLDSGDATRTCYPDEHPARPGITLTQGPCLYKSRHICRLSAGAPSFVPLPAASVMSLHRSRGDLSGVAVTMRGRAGAIAASSRLPVPRPSRPP